MNTVAIVGRLATDPQLDTPKGNPICTFRIAIDRGRDNGADFIPVKTFGRPAENHHRYLAKGRLVSIEGRISHSQWTDEEGHKRERYEVIANRIGYLRGSSVTPDETAAGDVRDEEGV